MRLDECGDCNIANINNFLKFKKESKCNFVQDCCIDDETVVGFI